MIITLTLFAGISGATLATINQLTKAHIEVAAQNKKNAAIREVLPEFDNNPFEEQIILPAEGAAAASSRLYLESASENLTFYPATKNGELIGVAVETFTDMGFGGRIVLMVGFLPNGTIYKTSVISHSETPGLGDKIESSKSNFSSQLNGQHPATFRLMVRKDGGDVDAITASTITSRAFCDALVRAYNAFTNLKKQAGDE